METDAIKNQRKSLEEMPGPAVLPELGNTISILREDRLDWLSGLSAKYGRLTRLKLIYHQVVLVQSPEWLKYILQTNYKDFSKQSKAIEKGKKVFGNGLFTSEGEFWRKQRKLAQPAFHRERLAEMSRVMIDCISSMLDEWENATQEDGVTDFAQEMLQLTLNVVTRSMFHTTLSDKEFDTFKETFPAILKETNRRILNQFDLLTKIPTKDSLNYEKNIERLDAILFRMIDERKNEKKESHDLLGMLMAAVDAESGTGMNEKQLRDEIMTIFIAGHETTAQALCWAVFLLEQHPETKEKLNKEIADVLGGRLPVPSDFVKLPYTLQVFKEAMRLYPPLPIFIRSAEKPFIMDGYQIPANTKFMIPPYLMHHDAEYWDQPSQFRPERFTPEAEKSQPKFTYFPFGGGPRICIGNNFAMMEAVFALAMVSQRFRVEIVSPEKVEADFSLTLRPKNGLPVRLKKK